MFEPGDWVTLKPEADIPAIFRPDGKPTRGRVEEVCGRRVEVWIPIGGADVDEHSQCVFYDAHVLVAERRKGAS